MEVVKGKISIRQAFILLMVAIYSPSLRVIPNYIAGATKEATWITPLIGIVFGIAIVLVINNLFKKNPEVGLYEVYQNTFGKIGAKVVGILYIIWVTVLSGLYLRFFGERFLSTILFGGSLEVLISVMLIFAFFIINSNLEKLGRLSELMNLLFFIMFIVIFALVVPQIKINNLLPVTYYDIGPIFKSLIPILSLASYVTPLMILGDKIRHKEELGKQGIITMIVLGILAFILVLITVGISGYEINQQFIFPYFITLKNIQILNSIERIESIFISFWIATDLAIISLFMYALTKLTKSTFNLKSQKTFIVPASFLVFILSLFIANNSHELETFSKQVVTYINIALFILIPVLSLIIGKIRKTI